MHTKTDKTLAPKAKWHLCTHISQAQHQTLTNKQADLSLTLDVQILKGKITSLPFKVKTLTKTCPYPRRIMKKLTFSYLYFGRNLFNCPFWIEGLIELAPFGLLKVFVMRKMHGITHHTSFWKTIKLLSTEEGGLSTKNCSFPRSVVRPLNSPLSLIGLGLQILMLGFSVSMLDNYQKAGHTPTVIMLIFWLITVILKKNQRMGFMKNIIIYFLNIISSFMTTISSLRFLK